MRILSYSREDVSESLMQFRRTVSIAYPRILYMYLDSLGYCTWETVSIDARPPSIGSRREK
jgi:hypothetical protein